MNPDKKVLNPKNNSPWLLCPSKRLPGKYYYFNSSTGETAWCLSEPDKNLKKGTIHRVTDKTHTYPEPFDPPIDADSTNTTNSFTSLKNAGNTEFSNAKDIRPTQVFGQAVFPEYVSPDTFPHKFVWILTPMYLLNPPLPKAQSESDSTPKSALKASRSVENLTTLFTKDVETSTISRPHKVDNETGKLSKLDKNDLRFKLLAKKRKVDCATQTEKTVTVKSADQTTSKPREVLTQKKRVTCDIQEPASQSSDDVEETDQPSTTFRPRSLMSGLIKSPESSRVEELSQSSPDGPWYVVTDATGLLGHSQCIEDFLKSDPRCRLLVPHAVYTELARCRRGDSGALSARHQLIRKLAAHASDIVVQSKPDYELSPEDNILQCCWTLLQEYIHVVLISNNTNMLNKAKSLQLECYNLEEIKTVNQTTAELQSDLKRPKIIEETDKNKSKNLFMQDLSEVNSLPKPYGFSVCESRKNILETGTNTGNPFSKRDANSDDDGDSDSDLSKPKVNTVFDSEITNMNDQFTKLSIAGYISEKNTTLDLRQSGNKNETIYTVSSDNDVKFNDGNEKANHLSDDFILDDFSVSASSVNTECARAYPLAKMFLLTLKNTTIKIFDFIRTSLQEYQEGMPMDKKAETLKKTELARQYVLKITERLKNIIARKSSDGTSLKDLLIKAGDYAEDDLIITNYRQTVAKFLEQTQLLDKALEHMLSLLNAVSADAKEEAVQ